MKHSRVEIGNSLTGVEVSLEPLNNKNIDDAAFLLLPPDKAALHGLIESDVDLIRSPEVFKDYINNPNEQLAWMISADGSPVGVSHLWGIGTEYPGVSTFITRGSNRGKGVGAMARAGLLSSHAFESGSSVQLVQTATLLGNIAASRSLEKLGFYIAEYMTDDAGQHLAQKVDGQVQYVPRWIVVNPNHTPDQNEYAATQLGRESQEKFKAYVQELQVTLG